MTNNKNLPHFLNIAIKSQFNYVKTLIWDKVSPLPNQFYMDRHEYIILLRKGRAVKVNDNSIASILTVNSVKKNNLPYVKHLTEKPVELMEIFINQSTKENEIVLDCFMGNGSTGVACKNLNRDFIGIELEKKYFDIAVDRINNTK